MKPFQDPKLFFSALFLALIGAFSLWKSGDTNFFARQILFIIIGFVLFVVASKIDHRVFGASAQVVMAIYGIAVTLLAGLFIFADPIRGTLSWYSIGGFLFDPSEVAKIAILLLLAKFFSQRHVELYNSVHIIISALYVAVPFTLVLMQPNLGSALVLFAIWFGIVIVSGIRLRHFFVLVAFGILSIVAAWSFVLKDYQKERITSFILPSQARDLDEGWQQRQSEIAIGSGGIFGIGSEEGSQIRYGFLPANHTDFIFASLIEQAGLLGALLLLGGYTFLLWSICVGALRSSDNFTRLYASGLLTLFMIQFVINIGMNLGLAPVVGIGLPLISYGGSGLLVNLFSIGLLDGMRRRNRLSDRIV